ncbi:hypothetical protein [Zhenpiania hominis]|uniref:Uncharacterized protein n=1 Tax=Zhenpiania hominis TaxID=2763644 RepID=A0A923NP64_9FIRM|nr:hypothetical protein [Zhenpiania hominis]MBC6679568.1 hypothetical protein [Zhenpiania hominis]
MIRLEYPSLYRWTIGFAVLFSSMVGGTILGISMNKIALIPLFIVLCIERIQNVNINPKMYLRFPHLMFVMYCILCGISDLIALFNSSAIDKYPLYLPIAEKNAIQMIIVYIPLALLVWNSVYCKTFKNIFFKALKYVAYIHCGWAGLQFICFTTLQLDVNTFFFEEVWHGILGIEYGSVYTYENGILAMRITGLTCDTAYLSILLVLGFLMSKSWIPKAMCIGVTILSMSRTGMLAMVVAIILEMIMRENKNQLHLKKLFMGINGFLLACGVMVILYMKIPEIQYYVDYSYERVKNIWSFATGGTYDSTSIHLNYLLYLIPMFITMLNPLQCFVGVGPRVSIPTYIEFAKENNLAYEHNYTHSLSIECDVADLLIGSGLIGFFLYYYMFFTIFFHTSDKMLKKAIVIFVIAGVTYQFNAMTLLILFIIIALGEFSKLRTLEDYERDYKIGEIIYEAKPD